MPPDIETVPEADVPPPTPPTPPAPAAPPAVRPQPVMRQQLSIGRIVHFVRGPQHHAPAIVTRVHNATCCNLTVFTDTDGEQRQESVCQGIASTPGTWHWPEPV